MASIRTLKKNIDNLIEAVLADCFLTIYFQPNKQDLVVGIMKDTVNLRNDLYRRSNVRLPKTGKSSGHYRAIKEELYTGVDRLFTQLSDVCRKG